MTSNIPTWYNQLLRKNGLSIHGSDILTTLQHVYCWKKSWKSSSSDDLSSAVHWSVKSEVSSQEAVKHMVFFTSWVHTVEAPLDDPNCWITTRKSQLVLKLCRFIQTAGWGGRALLPEKQSLQFSRVFFAKLSRGTEIVSFVGGKDRPLTLCSFISSPYQVGGLVRKAPDCLQVQQLQWESLQMQKA